MKTGDITRQRSLSTARTEVNRVRRETTRQIYEENSDVITGWEWVAAKSTRTCVVCLAQDGKTFKLKDEFPQHVNCRCTLIAVIDGVERPPRTLGKDWFEKQSDVNKEKVLGKEAFLAFKNGDVELIDFVDYRHHKQFGRYVYRKPLGYVLADKSITPVADMVKEAFTEAGLKPRMITAKRTRSRYIFAEGIKIRVSDHEPNKSKINELDLRPDTKLTKKELVKFIKGRRRKQ